MTPPKSVEKIGKFSSVTHGGHQFPTSLTTHLLSLLTFIIIADFKEKAIGKMHKKKDFFRIVLCILTGARAVGALIKRAHKLTAKCF